MELHEPTGSQAPRQQSVWANQMNAVVNLALILFRYLLQLSAPTAYDYVLRMGSLNPKWRIHKTIIILYFSNKCCLVSRLFFLYETYLDTKSKWIPFAC